MIHERVNIITLLNFYTRQVENDLLPFWHKAVDRTSGGVYTCFNNAGNRLVSTDKYTWSQGRFLWLWAKIAGMISENKLEGNAGDYLDQSEKTVLFLEDNVFLDNGNCAFLLSERGKRKEIIAGQGFDSSIYADCFVVLSMAAYANVTKDRQRFETALKLYDRIRERVKTDNIRSEPYPIPKGYRAHAIVMIMLHMSQELADAAKVLNDGKSQVLQQHSVSYMQDIMDNFCREDHRIVELLPINSTKERTLLYNHINPGHTIESMWFVIDTAQKVDHSDYIRQAIQAIQKAINVGWDSKWGGLFRFVDKNGGKPQGKKGFSPYGQLVEDSWDMKLWWPHSEALYAAMRAYILSGNKNLWLLYEKIHDYVFSTFPNPDKKIGEWIQIRDRKGEPIDKIAALPVKDPFHILRNMLLIIDLLDEMRPKS